MNASPFYHGQTPYTHPLLFRRHIRPVIEKVAGLTSNKDAPIGCPTLRRSLATLLISNDEIVKVVQGAAGAYDSEDNFGVVCTDGVNGPTQGVHQGGADGVAEDAA